MQDLKSTMAGVVAFRRDRGRPEILMIPSERRHSDLPRTVVRDGETPRQAAIRALHHAGATGRVLAPAGGAELRYGDEPPIRVSYCLVHCDLDGAPPAIGGTGRWFPLDEARRRLPFRETRALLARCLRPRRKREETEWSTP